MSGQTRTGCWRVAVALGLTVLAVSRGQAVGAGPAVPDPGSGAEAAAAPALPAAGSDPRLARVVQEIDPNRLLATVSALAAFGTRHTYSDASSGSRGIGAARRFIAAELRRASPRLQVTEDKSLLPAQGGRLVADVELVNVIGILPGSAGASPARILVSGHYDSVARAADGQFHWDQGDLPAPGANDDGSGTAAVIELARAVSGLDLESTVVFAAFAGEEQGLVGSTLYASRAAEEHEPIVAVLNNDIIGNDTGGSGRTQGTRVHLYSGGPDDSPSRELARYVEWMGEILVPGMDVRPILRSDRFGRGGDHTPFARRGFAAVRLTVAEEDYSRQHDIRDTPEGMSARYLAEVTRVNAAALVALALAPPAPVVVDARGLPMLDRGPSGYDARLRWEMPAPPPDLAGFEIVMRDTLSPRWEKAWTAAPATREMVLPGVSIDTVTFGVRAVDRDGNRSLAAPYVMVEREAAEYRVKP